MTSIMMPRSFECPHCSSQFKEYPVPYSRLGEVAPPLLTDGHRFGMYRYTPLFCGGCGGVLWMHDLQPIELRDEKSKSSRRARPKVPDFSESLEIASGAHGIVTANRELLVRLHAKWKANDESPEEGGAELDPDVQGNLEALLPLLDENTLGERVEKADVLRTLGRHEEALQSLDRIELLGDQASEYDSSLQRAQAVRILSEKKITFVLPLAEALELQDPIFKSRSRLSIRTDWKDRNVWITFADRESGIAYCYPHDSFIRKLEDLNPGIFETASWKAGEYNWPTLPERGQYSWIREWLEVYRKGEGSGSTTSDRSPEPLDQESEAYLQAVRDWRNYWRPKKVRCLLIAESHVRENGGDTQARMIPLHQFGLSDHPTSFCRLIYCLGYGESELLTRPVQTNQRGTLQFWDIFGALASCVIHPDMGQPRKGQSDLNERIGWKIDTLKMLKRRGIWLVDACPRGLYVPGKERKKISDEEFKRRFMEEVLPELDTEELRSTWIIGKTVHDKIAEVTPSLKGWVYQSQGWRQSQSGYREHLTPMIEDICKETEELSANDPAQDLVKPSMFSKPAIIVIAVVIAIGIFVVTRL